MAVFSAGTEAPQLREVMPLEIDGVSTSVPDLSATLAPGAIFLNHGDHAFAKIILDPISLAFVQERLERFDDPLIRLLLWHTLWTMVRDRAFRSTDYLALAIDKLARETNLELISAVLSNAQFAWHTTYRRISAAPRPPGSTTSVTRSSTLLPTRTNGLSGHER